MCNNWIRLGEVSLSPGELLPTLLLRDWWGFFVGLLVSTSELTTRRIAGSTPASSITRPAYRPRSGAETQRAFERTHSRPMAALNSAVGPSLP